MIATSYTPISQKTLLPIINEYLQSTNIPTIKIGACRPLVLHHCIKKFQGKAAEHSQLVHRVAKEKFEGITQCQKLQEFCHTIAKLDNPKKMPYYSVEKNLKQFMGQDDPTLYSSFHLTGNFNYNSDTGLHDHLGKLLQVVISVKPKVEKYIIMSQGSHTIGIDISAKDNSYELNDSNVPNFVPPVSIDKDKELSFIDYYLPLLSEKSTLSLTINVITDEDISSEMNNCEALNQLRAEVLKVDPNKKGCCNFTPFPIALRNHFFDDAKALIDSGANPDLCLNDDSYPIFDMVSLRDSEGLEQLCQMGGTVDLFSKHDRTPLWEATCNGYPDIVEVLLKHNANVNQEDAFGASPLSLAKLIKNTDRKKAAEDLPELANDERYKEYLKVFELLENAATVT